MVISDYGNRSFDDFNENDDGVDDDYQHCWWLSIMNRTISEKRNIDVNMFEGGPNSGTVWSKLIPTT